MSLREVKLGAVSSSIQTGPFGSQLHQSDYSVCGTPVVMPKDIIDGCIMDSSIARVEQRHVDRLSRHKVKTGDILYSRRGDVGKCAYVRESQEGWLCGTGCLRVTVNKEVALPQFIFYQLQMPETVGWVEKHAIGATMPNLNTSILSDIPLVLPDLATQERIASILSAYDDLIEVDRKQIRLLEEAAERLYREWFVELRFPGYEHATFGTDGLPTGWKKENIGKRFDLFLGGTPSRNNSNYWDNGTIPWINSGAVNKARIIEGNEYITELAVEKSATKLLPVHCTLIAITGATLGQVSYNEIETCANQSVVAIKEKSNLYDEYMLNFIKHNIDGIINKANGSAQQHINKGILEEYQVVLPNESIIREYHDKARVLDDEVYNLMLQIKQASAARNILLPRLMKGEIEL